jgi:phage protein D
MTSTMLQPAFKVVLDGVDLTTRIMPRLGALTITSTRQDHADQLDLTFADTDGRLALPRVGVDLDVMLGYANTGVRLQGTYTVDEVEHSGTPDSISLKARSARVSGPLRTRKERSWHATTVGHVVNVIAGEHGLTPRVASAIAATPIAHLDQTESDMAFLRRLGKQWDAVATVKAGRLIFAPIGHGQTAGGTTLDTIALVRATGDQHRYHVAERDAYSGVRTHWYDVAAATTKGTLAGTKGHVKVLRGNYASEEEAKRAATAEMARVTRGACTFELQCAIGRPDIYPEMPVRLVGWGDTIGAVAWIVTSVTHRLDGNAGYTTALSLENKAAASEHPAQDDDGNDDSEGEA